MKAIWLISTLYLLPFAVLAKGDDTTEWKSFELIASRNHTNTGSMRINLPASTDGSIADLLNQNSALFVKYYSPGSLASTSMRGMGAQHTAVLWNGINLQSCMNSNMDLNLLPSFFIDQASLETGANASSCVNGALAGALVLNNSIFKGKRVFAEFGLGSFGQRQYAAGFSYTYKKLNSNTRILHRSAENDFEFINIFKVDKPIERVPNNRFLQTGIMQEFSLAFKKNNTLYFNFWHLQTKRQIPPIMGASILAEEKQDDNNTMFLVRHEKRFDKLSINSKIAYLGEEINYFNKYLLPAFNSAWSAIAESEIKLQLKRGFEFISSVNYTRQHAETDGYRSGIDRNLLSLYTKLNWQSKQPKLRLGIANRQMLCDGYIAPSTPDFGFEYLMHKYLHIKGNAAYSFRLPSFNDLYWQPGGNPNLSPEKGKKAELSIEHKNKVFKLGATAFMHKLDNWILWLPDASSSNWMATNAKEVESRGFEFALDAKQIIRKTHFIRMFGRYQYVQSINTDVYSEDKSIVGKQLLYTPLHTGSATLQYMKGAYRLNCNSTFTGSRYTTVDNNPDNFLESFMLFNISLAREINFKKYTSILEFTVNNVLNTSYTVFEYRPMPLRNFYITYKLQFNYE